PFGDTGIWSMFDDAGDLGNALSASSNSSLVRSAQAIADIFVQYAAKLAIGDVTGDTVARAGVLTNSSGALSVDFADSLWTKGADGSYIIGREPLISSALSSLYTEFNPANPAAPQPRSDLTAALRWFAYNNGISYNWIGELIDRVTFQIG